MKMLKTLLRQLKEYKKAVVTAPIFTAFEVLLEVLILDDSTSAVDTATDALGRDRACGGTLRNRYGDRN